MALRVQGGLQLSHAEQPPAATERSLGCVVPGTICPRQAKQVLLLAGDRDVAQTRCTASVGTYAAVEPDC